MTNIEKLEKAAEGLVKLMADPQPGLYTWQKAYQRIVDEIVDYASTDALRECLSKRAGGDSQNRLTTVEDDINALILMLKA